MADQFSRLYDVERVGGDQRTRLAELLRSQGMNQPQGQMVSGWYVPPSWSQNLNSALQMGLGTYMGLQQDEEKKAKTAELLRQLSQGKEVEPIPAVQNFNGMERMAEGQTPMPQQAPQNELERLTRKPQMPVEQTQMNPAMTPRQEQRFVPLSEEEKIGKVMELAQYNPYAAQVWSAQDTARQNRLTRAEERELDFQRRKELQQQQLEGRMDMARFAASMRQPTPEPLVAVLGKDGNPIMLPRGQAVGMTPFNAQTAGGAGTPGARVREATEAIDIVNQAAPLIRKSTASGVGAGVDWAAGLIGKSPEGADVAAQLKVLGGALVSKMPKMSGPQSDKDVMLYKEMAGRLGDPTVPTSQKEAALQTIYNLNAKYAGYPEQTLSFEPSVMSGYGVPPAGAVRVKGQ